MKPIYYIKSSFKTLTKFELILWLCSVAASLGSIFVSGSSGIFSAIASVIGATCLIFAAKGNVMSQVLSIIFALLYSIISLTFRYLGEMITYAGMTLPMAVWSLIAWLKNPYNESEVKVNVISCRETIFMFILTAVVTLIFFFVLAFLNTPNLAMSTVSITTSFLACYLVARRSEYYALAYAANDIVL
ncbi:MAG: nicotinamide mononucleotide transporter, partial [Clostridia bacterium]|nr:nicotinamide mononucleotide transporter [Clostridia bacterium]